MNENPEYSLVILQIPIPLRSLRPEIDKMAPEQQVIFRRNGHGVACKGGGVEEKGAGHAAGYTMQVVRESVCDLSTKFAQLRGKPKGLARGSTYISGSF